MKTNNHTLPDDFDWDTYIKTTSDLLGLPLDDVLYPGVKANLLNTYNIAESLLSLELPDGLESPAIFRP